MTDDKSQGSAGPDGADRLHTPSTRAGSPRPSGVTGAPRTARTTANEAAGATSDGFVEPRQKLTFAGAPVTAGLLLAMTAIEFLLIVGDGAGGQRQSLREVVYTLFAFSPFVTFYSDIGLWGAVGVVTHVFLHGGLLHLGFNALALAFLGPPLERAMGPWRYALLFALAGVGGAFGHAAWQYGVTLARPEFQLWPMTVQLVGASGAISGLLAGEIYRRMEIVAATPPQYRAISPGRLLWNSSIGFVLINVALSAMGSFISGSAHLGGFVVGLAAAAAMGIDVTRRR